MDNLLDLWGKTAPQGYHPAVFHMMDAGNVAMVMLEANTQWRSAIDTLFQGMRDSAGLVAYIVALHDLGKISAAFQGQVDDQKERLKALGWDFGGWRMLHNKPHPIIGQATLASEENSVSLHLDTRLSEVVSEVIGGHHGTWQPKSAVQTSVDDLELDEPLCFATARQQATDFLFAYYGLDDKVVLVQPANISTASMLLTGFSILCDWIASDTRFFPAASDIPVEHYAELSKARANEAVQKLGFSQANLSGAPSNFSALFGFSEPRPLQLAIDAIPTALLEQPSLTIIEAPTGEGKTEAALALAHRIGLLRGSDAFYYALPTMATSNQMYARVSKYLQNELDMQRSVRLVHGQAALAQDLIDLQGLEMHTESADIAQWFAPRKRALLAPFGVGTIDQAELAALNTRHAALRMLGLAGQTLIVDEVHAYDMYMTTIIERLLRWLSELNASVILMSATLPQERMRRLQAAWSGGKDVVVNGSYPHIAVVTRQGESWNMHVASSQSERHIAIDRISLPEEKVEVKANLLLDLVAEGGCAVWITNTVSRAQELYRQLKTSPRARGVQLDLLHARFPLEQRLALESRIAGLYGKEGKRPQRGIVIGTQVLEQSLDLDFDVMASDLAPIDLLLQRAGRMHRHQRPRPVAHAAPRLIVNMPSAEIPIDETVDAKIYDAYLLARTRQLLDDRNLLVLPDEYRPLIEGVYGTELILDAKTQALHDQLEQKEWNAAKEAEERLLPEPSADFCFCRLAAQKAFREDEDSADWMVARTRLGPPSVTVLPLERDADKAWIPGQKTHSFDLKREPSREDQLLLLRQQVRLSGAWLSRLIAEQAGEPCPLMGAPLLRYVTPLWLEDGRAELGSGAATLQLDDELGLTIDWKGGKDEPV